MRNHLLLALGLGCGPVALAQASLPALRTQALVAYHDKQYRASGPRYDESFRQPAVQP